ncbi:MAG: YdcF family protein [Gemmatimonadaceae bacterium]|nr:YdcF family protein [Gemmatimonadaceae bacterium]
MARRRRSLPGTILRFFARALLLLLVVWGVSIAAVLVAGHRDAAQPAGAIVVLGAAQYAGRPSPVLTARLDHAIALYRSTVAPYLIVTGGKATGDITSEAETSARYARQHGVPAKAIILEDESRSTTEQMHAVARIVRARDLGAVVLVSDRFHMLRLLLTAWKLDLTAYGSPTRSSPIVLSDAAGIRYVLAESLKAPLAFLLEEESPR